MALGEENYGFLGFKIRTVYTNEDGAGEMNDNLKKVRLLRPSEKYIHKQINAYEDSKLKRFDEKLNGGRI